MFNHSIALLCTFLCLAIISIGSPIFGQEHKDSYKLEENIPYRSGENLDEYMKERCVLDLYYPENVEGYPTIIWFHGGGLSSGEKFIPDELKDKGFAVAAVNYRLHPKVKAPVYIEDAAAATAWVVKNIKEYGGNEDKIVISGFSAGGYLTAMVGMDKHFLAEYDIDVDTTIAGLVPFSGHMITHFTVRKERGIPGTQPVIDELAPIYFVRKDTPPIVLITGGREYEMLGRYEENAYMYRMLKVAGNENVKLFEQGGCDHGGMLNGAFPLLVREAKLMVE